MIKVSAIIPCYNSESTVKRAVISCMQQSYNLYEVIVVNDGSTDNSSEVLNAIKNYYHSLIIINQQNQGVCAARNKGIAKASGDYLLMLDSDDYFEPSFVEKALQTFQNNPSHASVMSGFKWVRNGRSSKSCFFKQVDLKSCLFDNGMMACVLFKKKALINVGLYDENMIYAHEDWDLNIRLLKAGYTFGIINEPLYYYTSNQNSRSNLSVEKDIEMRLIIYKKYEEDFKQHGLYLFQSFSRELIQLRKQNKRILESRSYILSEKLVKMYLKIKKIIGRD